MLKTILLTMTATTAALSLAAALFLNSILGFFGLAATSVQTLSQLRTSQQVLEQIKKRHAVKRKHSSKRLVKRSGRRVASTALAAATVGTVGVAVVMTGLEIEDHCDQKRSLQEEANLLHGAKVDFDYELCLQQSHEDARAILSEATDSVQVAAAEVLATSGDYGRQTLGYVLSAWRQGVEATGEAASGLWARTVTWMLGDGVDHVDLAMEPVELQQE